MIHESPIVEFLAESIKSTILSDANFQRLRASVRKKLKQKGQAPSINLKPLRQRLTKLDGDLKNAMAELARTPADLYDLAVDHVREVRQERDRAAAQLDGAISQTTSPVGDSDADVDRVVSRLEMLRTGLSEADPRIAREAMGHICERIDLHFGHTHYEKMVRSQFLRGLVTFKTHSSSETYNNDGYDQGALLMSS